MCEEASESKQEPKKYRITKENAAEFCKSAAAAKKARAEMRRKLLQTAISVGIEKYFEKAIKTMDPDAIAVVERASKLVGLDFGSSEEAVQRVNAKVDAKTDSKLEIVVKEV